MNDFEWRQPVRDRKYKEYITNGKTNTLIALSWSYQWLNKVQREVLAKEAKTSL